MSAKHTPTHENDAYTQWLLDTNSSISRSGYGQINLSEAAVKHLFNSCEKLKADNAALLEAAKEARPYVFNEQHPAAFESLKLIDKAIAQAKSEVRP